MTRARDVFVLGWPILVGQIAVLGNGVIDTIMAGQRSAEDLAVIGLGAWFACWLALRKNVLIPVEAIARYLSRLRHGRIERLVCETKATEIEIIITGINQLAERLKVTSPGDLNAALTAVQELRVHLNRVSATDPETKVPVMRALTRLESSLLLLLCKEAPEKE